MRTDFSNNPLVKCCFAFSLMIIKYTEELEQKKRFVLANQLLRSGTAIGACVMEAQSAESKADFVHKLKIADKEAFETFYWMTLCKEAGYDVPEEMLPKLEEIMRLLSAIIHTAKKRSNITQTN